MYVYETPIRADFALIKAELGDRWGNHPIANQRNFDPLMAMAATVAIASVHEVVPLEIFIPSRS